MQQQKFSAAAITTGITMTNVAIQAVMGSLIQQIEAVPEDKKHILFSVFKGIRRTQKWPLVTDHVDIPALKHKVQSLLYEYFHLQSGTKTSSVRNLQL